ncbi:MAG: lysine--tRNA ligase [Patescibacteria group bacterium]
MNKEKVSERDDRIKKLEEIKQAGVNPYPAKTNRDYLINQALVNFDQLNEKQTKITIAGRLRSLREHGNLTFAHLEDSSGNLQLAFSKKELQGATTNGAHPNENEIEGIESANSYKFFSKYVDVGDFIEATGVVFTTRRGEKSLMVKSWSFLTKALRPLPEKWHGLQDEEERLRKRYLDIIFNPEVKDVLEKRAKFWNATRAFLINKGFLEVETPVLENITGGADARPFITHHNALDMDVYLRISMGELWQKRLMVAGLEKTFEIGRQFRNEGMDAEHLQDYTQMEFYWAYADYEDGMKLVEELLKYIALETFNTLKFKIGKFEIDLNKKWEIYDYSETIEKYTNINILKTDIKEIEAKLQELDIKYDKKGFNITRAIDNLWKYCRKNIVGPGFLVNVPIIMEPLAKRMENNLEFTQRFQVILAGSELGKGYSELNDPIDQAERFANQQKLREAGDDEAQMFDQEFIEAMEYGMPPVCGFGMSERVFSFLMNKPARECQIFPLMKLKNIEEFKKTKETKIAVAIINKELNLKSWEKMNTIAHLNAAFGARKGKELLIQDAIITKDNEQIKLNIQHAIIIKQANSNQEILNLIKIAQEKKLEKSEFIREMIETTNDKKIIERINKKDLKDVEYLGVLIFGEKSVVEELTKKLKLFK